MIYALKVLRAIYTGEADLAKGDPLTTFHSARAFRRGEVEIQVEFHDYYIFGVYARCGFRWTPARQPIAALYNLWGGQPAAPPYHPAQVDNVTLPPPLVVERQHNELRELCCTFDVIYWEHFRHCYPLFAQHFKQWFKHSISLFGDDCPACVPLKTGPVAKFFDSAIHGNLIFDGVTGLSTAQHYRNQGVCDTHYVAMNASDGFTEGLAAINFSIEKKIADLKNGQCASTDIVFVGPLGGPRRAALAGAIGSFRAAGLVVRFHGLGMPDGPVPSPGENNYPQPRAAPLAPIYATSFAGVIPAVWGLVGTRLWDYWEAGVLVFMHDPVGELALIGVEAGVHYVAYDGTPQGLLAGVLDMRKWPRDAARIVEAGHVKGCELVREYNSVAAVEKILFANLHKWRRVA